MAVRNCTVTTESKIEAHGGETFFLIIEGERLLWGAKGTKEKWIPFTGSVKIDVDKLCEHFTCDRQTLAHRTFVYSSSSAV